jgi:polyhydroxyalkanoate synthesis regulator phasin
LVALLGAYFVTGEYLRVTFLGKDEKTKALLDDLNRSMKNEQSYVLAVTYSSLRATEQIAGRTETTVGKTNEDVQRLTQTVETLSAAAKGMCDTIGLSE